MIDTIAEKKFLLLKKRLDALHYCQPFGPDSSSLVERLLNDLIKTTEGFQSLKKNNDELKEAASKAEVGLDPLKFENRRLLKENNDLHVEMIRIKEEAEFNQSRWQNKLKSLEGNHVDFKHVIQARDATFAKLQDENAALKKKMEFIIKKHYLGHGKGLDNVPPELRGLVGGKTAKFDVTKTLKPTEVGEDLEVTKKSNGDDGKIWAESLRRADDKVNTLKDELKLTSEVRASLEDGIKQLEIQVMNRDVEIKRLQAKLDVGGGDQKLSIEHGTKANAEKINRLNAQIDYLTRENNNLEEMSKGLQKDLSRSGHLKNHNSTLESKLKDYSQKNDELRATLKNKDRVLDKMRDSKALAESEFIEKKDQQIQALENEVVRLSKDLDDAIEDNSKLRLESNQAGQTLSAYNSDKLAFSEIIHDLKQAKADLESKVDDLQVSLDRKTLENQTLSEEVTVSQGKIQSMQREIDLLKQNVDKNLEDHQQSNEATRALRNRVAELETDNLALNSQKKDLETQIERSNKLREHVEEQLNILKDDNYKTKANVETTSTAKQRLQILLEESQKDVEFLKKDQQDLEAKYLNEKRTSDDLDIKLRECVINLATAQEKLKDSERDASLLREQLSLRMQDIRAAQGQNLNLEREYAVLKNTCHKYEEQIDKSRKLRDDIKTLEDEKARSVRRNEELQGQIRDLNEQITRQDVQLRKEIAAKDELNDKIESLAAETDHIDSNLRRAREREHDYNRLLVDLESLKKREKDLLEESEKLRRENRKLENLTANGTRQVDHLGQRNDELAGQVQSLRDELNAFKSNDGELKTKSIKLQEKINNLEVVEADLRDDRIKADKQLTEVGEELRRSRDELEKEKRINEEQKEKIHQLKTLAESLEKTKAELLGRLQNKINDRSLEEGERFRLQEDVRELKEKNNALGRQVTETMNILAEIDREKDILQNTLDNKTEMYERARKMYERQEDDLRRLKERSSEFMMASDVNMERVQDQDEKLKDLSRKNRTLLAENEDLKHRISLKEGQIEDLSNDLNALTRENQSIKYRMQGLIEEKEKARDAFGSADRQEKKARQTLRAAELEKDDLMNNYRTVCIENDRLKRDTEELNADNHDLAKRIKDYEREITYLRSQVQQLEIKEGQYTSELTSSQRNMDVLEKRLEQQESRAREAYEAKDRLRRDLDQSKRLNEGTGHSREELQRNLVQSEQEKVFLQDQIRDHQNEQVRLKQEIEFERRRVQELEYNASKEKSVQLRQSVTIRDLENAKVDLQNNIENCEQRIRALQNTMNKDAELGSLHTRDKNSSVDISGQRTRLLLEDQLRDRNSEIDSLINEQRTLREENSKLRLSLNKVEGERNEVEKRFRLQESFENTMRSSYGQLFSEGPSSKERSERYWDKLKPESDGSKRKFDNTFSSQYIEDKRKNLQETVGESRSRKY